MVLPASIDAATMHKIQQAVKWTVYALLIINFVFYFIEDARRAAYTLHSGSTFFDLTSAFATTIDESAWFILLAMFEIETYIVDDENWSGGLAKTVHGIRLLCFVMIAHTVYAFTIVVTDLQPTVVVENITSLCELQGDGLSYVYNLEYTEIDTETCGSLSTATEFYRVGNDPVVSDLDGLDLERDLALADLAEAVLWLFVLAAIEIAVRLQGRGITKGRLVSAAKYSTYCLYASLIALGVYWATLSHWLYLWDELVWIGGFAAIEMNLSEWREEIQDRQATIEEQT